MFVSFATRAGCALALLCSPVLSSASYSQTITLKAALQRALAGNPRLTAAAREMGVASGLRFQASALPNPDVSFELDNAFGSKNSQTSPSGNAQGGQGNAQSGDAGAQSSDSKPKDYRGLRSAETILQLSQLIELGGKRSARVAVGIAGENVAYWQYRAAELELLSETTASFIAIVAAQRRIEIYDEQIAVLDPLLPLLEKRVREGASSPAETLRAKAAAEMYRVERTRAHTQLDVARRELATLMGHNTPNFTRAQGRLGGRGRPPSFQKIVAAIEANPQLTRWTALIAQRDAELTSARAKAIPDVRVWAGWRHYNETKDNAVRLGLSVPLPIFDRNEGNIAAAQSNASKSIAEWSTAKLTLIGVASRTYATITGAQSEIRQLRQTVIPAARGAAETILDGYRQGRFTLLELLDSRSMLIQALLKEQEAQQNFHSAIATLEGLIGNPFALAQEIAQ